MWVSNSNVFVFGGLWNMYQHAQRAPILSERCSCCANAAALSRCTCLFWEEMRMYAFGPTVDFATLPCSCSHGAPLHLTIVKQAVFDCEVRFLQDFRKEENPIAFPSGCVAEACVLHTSSVVSVLHFITERRWMIGKNWGRLIFLCVAR